MIKSLNSYLEAGRNIESSRLLIETNFEKPYDFSPYIHDSPLFEESKTFTQDMFQKASRLQNSFEQAKSQSLSQPSIRRQSKYIKVNVPDELENLKGYISARYHRKIETVEHYTDKLPLLSLRQASMRIHYGISELCLRIINTSMFEVLLILVIVLNTIFLAIEDKNGNLPKNLEAADDFFLFFYTTECILKIYAYGFVFGKSSYLRDYWNILDFVIVVTGWADREAGSGVNLSAMRTLRILRPLRSISSISGMRVLFISLFKSIGPLLSALIVLFFFTYVFAIAALQLWNGSLRFKCMELNSGVFDSTKEVCGSELCDDGYKCVNVLDNPNYGTIHFDNIFISLIMIFQIITLEGWTQILLLTQKAFSFYSVIFYVPLVFIGSTLILNLTLAIITSSFFEAMQNVRETKVNNFYSKLQAEAFNGFEDKIASLKNSSIIKSGYKSDYIATSRDESFVQRLSGNQSSQARPSSLERVADSNREQFEPAGYQLSSLGASMAQRGTRSNQSLLEKESDLITRMVILKRIKSILVMRKEMTSIDVESASKNFKFHLEINKDFPVSSTSSQDVLHPIKKAIEKLGYSFTYTTFIEEGKPDLSKYEDLGTIQKIRRFVMAFCGSQGFFVICPSVREEILALEDSFSIQKNIQAQYSGYDVNSTKDYESIIHCLNLMSFRKWSHGYKGVWERAQFPLKSLMKSKHMSTAMIILVLFNTACLASDHYGIKPSHASFLKITNNVLTYIFAFEIFLRIIGLGVCDFCRDLMNYFDLVVVILSIIEIAVFSNSTSAISAFRAIRVFRIFRVLRVVRILRYLQSMGQIVKAISKSLFNFFYLFLLLSLFLVIFSLLGRQLFAGKFDFPEGLPRGHFDTFHWAFVTTFILLSTENWNEILTSSMRSELGPPSSLFLIFWIVLGNFVLLNLFLAILLESFSSDFYESYVNEEDDLKRENIVLRVINKKTRRKLLVLSQYNESESDSEREATEMIEDTRKKTIWNEMQGNMCIKSLYIFDKKNKIRLFCFRLIKAKEFEFFIILIIIINTLKLVVDTYLIDYPEEHISIKLSHIFDYILTIIFFIEFAIKTVALGFFRDKGTYFKDDWNKLDLIIVIFSILDSSISSINLPIIKVFRLLRTLRPLRLINHNLSMKIVVIALLESLSAIFNVTAVILVIWLIYSILGVSLLSGKMYSCSNSSISSQNECIMFGHSWVNKDMNFDDVIQAMITLFVVMSQESWPNRMYEGVDAYQRGESEVENSNPYIAYFYIGYLIIGNFFMVNLFTAVVFNKFNEAKINESSIASLILSKSQKCWTDIQGYIKKSTPGVQLKYTPSNKISVFCFKVSKSKTFDLFIIFLILFNMIVLSMTYHQSSDYYKEVLEKLNLALTICFILEATIKIIGWGFKRYISDNWNKIDFTIIIASIIDICFGIFVIDSSLLLRQIPQLIRVIRVLRVSRIFRLVKSLESLKKITMVTIYALPAILNVLSLLTLVFFIFAILGVYLFHTVENTGVINDYFNFKNFDQGMSILWRISTGEDYPTIMFECSNNLGSKVYLIYFLVFVTLIDYVILDLFVSVIIQNYEEFSTNDDSAINKFRGDIKVFKKHWSKFTEESSGLRISRANIEKFLIECCSEFRIIESNKVTQDSTRRLIMNLTVSIFCDPEGFFYFNDVLFAVMKRKYDKKFFRVKSEYTKKILMMEESKTIKVLAKIRKKVMKKLKLEPTSRLRSDNFFINMMYLKTVFKSWRNYTQKRKNNQSESSLISDDDYPGINSVEEASEYM